MRTRRPLFNLANCLTLSRFFFAPVILVLLDLLRDPALDAGAWRYSLAVLVVLVVTLLTDLFDGMVARARHEVTNFGKIMDPVADSTFFMTLLFGLSACPRFGAEVSLWFPILVLYREIAMHIMRRYAALKGNAVPAKLSGKVKMFSQSLATVVFFLLVLARDLTGTAGAGVVSEAFLGKFALYLCCFTVAVTYWSLIEYYRDVPELIAEYATTPADAPADPGVDRP
ncbi:MAG: CDP-alcohol phosphatidyltransferase family protein [Planctomycetes bacterium]|nr:CDP-alcohol phosphatidyltransferase family protein [Planctomycetota bacterium]